MPNKTIYVKDADLPLLEQAQAQLGDSVSSMFAEFLHERAVINLTPEENRIIDLINRINRKREILAREQSLPKFLDGEYVAAERHAERSLKSLRSGEIRTAKALYWAANTYYERAERDFKELTELVQKVAALLSEGDQPSNGRVKGRRPRENRKRTSKSK